MTYGQEVGVHLRAVLTEISGRFEQKNWEDKCAKDFRHAWFTDCRSLYDYLCNPVAAGCEDKRLEIDLEGLCEYLWEFADGSPKDSMAEDMHDKPRWIDTSAMLCDPLTKSGNEKFAERLVQCMRTRWFDTTATAESTLKKLAKQKANRMKKLDELD